MSLSASSNAGLLGRLLAYEFGRQDESSRADVALMSLKPAPIKRNG